MNVFVYGTLTDPENASDVLDSFTFGPDATLDGCHPVEGAYPTLAPGGETVGRILRTPNVRALDAYEGVERDLYVRASVPGPNGQCAVYVGDPDRLDVDATWPGEGTLADRVTRYLHEQDVRVRAEEE